MCKPAWGNFTCRAAKMMAVRIFKAPEPQAVDSTLRLSPAARLGVRVLVPVLRTGVAVESAFTRQGVRGAWKNSLYQDLSRVDSFDLSPAGEVINLKLLEQLLKLRSMRANNGPYTGLGNKSPGVTKFGGKLRSTGLDELPQLASLAVVGQRPPLAADLKTIQGMVERGEISEKLFRAWAKSTQVLPSGLIDANSPVRKSDASSITNWEERMVHDVMFAAYQNDPDLAASIAITAVSRMLGGRKGKIAANRVGHMLGSKLTVNQADALYVARIQNATPDDAIRMFEEGRLRPAA